MVSVLLQLLKGVEHAHIRDVYHRDLKPANIFITEQGQVKVGDFGICKVLDGSSVKGNQAGTSIYMPPEAFERNDVSFESDIWAIGCIMHEIASGKYTFGNSNAKSEAKEVIKNRVCSKWPRRLSQNHSRPLRYVIYRMLLKDKSSRLSA